jgi:predicted phosphate transport protein (TIGR00153 family)
MLGSGHVGIWMGRQAEKEIISASEKHLEKIFIIIEKMQAFITSYCDDDLEAATYKGKEIVSIEREADVIKETIIDQLMNSSLHPMDQDEIIRLVLTSDDIAAQLKSTARKLLYTHSSEVPANIKAGLKEIIDAVLDESIALKATIESLANNKNDVRENAEKTERIEEAIDDMRVDLLAQILKWGDLSEHVSDWIMLKEAVENMEMASDKIEDTADVLRSIAILRGKKV